MHAAAEIQKLELGRTEDAFVYGSAANRMCLFSNILKRHRKGFEKSKQFEECTSARENFFTNTLYGCQYKHEVFYYDTLWV